MAKSDNAMPVNSGKPTTPTEACCDGIKTCTEMFTTEQQKQWSAISVFVQLSLGLVVASFLPEQVLGDQDTTLARWAGIVLGALGVTASLLWWSFNKRSEKIQHYWIVSARELENLMPETPQLFRRGAAFARGEAVIVDGSCVGYRGIETWPTRLGLNVIYFLYVTLFLLLILLNALRLTGVAS